MDFSFLFAALAALSLAAPFLLLAYIQRLPVAPACPSCRAVTRESDRTWLVSQAVTFLPSTFVGECARCGWKGRMRWRWATRSVKSRGDG